MSFTWCLRYLFSTLCFINIVRTVPPDYCLSPLNRSDCNMAPKTVFSYYKPGSRCERETWRGCPTANKFDNEYLCSLNCIFKMRQDHVDQCNVPLNQNICGKQKLVITHENGECIHAWWGGCPTYNKFEHLWECQEICVTEKPPTPTGIFDKLDLKPLEEINDILKNIIEVEITTTTEQEIETELTTEQETEEEEAKTEFTTEHEFETEPTTEESNYFDYHNIEHA